MASGGGLGVLWSPGKGATAVGVEAVVPGRAVGVMGVLRQDGIQAIINHVQTFSFDKLRCEGYEIQGDPSRRFTVSQQYFGFISIHLALLGVRI